MPCLSHSLPSVIKCLFGTWCDVKQGYTEETDRLLLTGDKTLLTRVGISMKTSAFLGEIYFLCDLFRIEFMCSNTGFIFVFALSSQVFALGYFLAKCSCMAWSPADSLLTSCVTADFFSYLEKCFYLGIQPWWSQDRLFLWTALQCVCVCVSMLCFYKLLSTVDPLAFFSPILLCSLIPLTITTKALSENCLINTSLTGC